MDYTAAATSRNHQLDGLRGYAALAVVIYHAILGLDPTQIQRILRPSLQNIDGLYAHATKIVLALVNGDTAVVVFFVMSGAVLFSSLQRENRAIGSMAAAFAVRRILRIYPTLIACLLVAGVAYPFFGLPSSVEDFLKNLALIDFRMNGASWTLNTEMLAAPLVFVGYLVFRRFREIGLAVFLIAILLLFKAKFFQGHLEYLRPYAFCFALGMLIPTRLGAFIGRRLHDRLWIVLLVLMIFAQHVILIGGYKTATNIQQISAALLVTSLYYDKARGLSGFLQRKVSVFLGRISYTLYLFNVPFLEIMTVVLRAHTPAEQRPLEFGLGSSIVTLMLTIPTAYAVTRWIEEPAIRLGRRLTVRRRTAPDLARVVTANNLVRLNDA